MTTTPLAETFKSRISLPPGLPKPNPTPAVWQQPPHPTIADAQSSTLPECVDVAIIGSGITGCAVAHALLHQSTSCRVVVLEARQAASGATGRNGGHLISDSSGLVPKLAQAIGSEAAREVAMFSEANIARVKELVQSLEEEDRKAVELRDVIGTAAFSDASMFAEAEKGLSVLKDVSPVSGLRHRSIPAAEAIEKYQYKDDIVGAFEQTGAAALWPYRLVTAILRQLLDQYPGRFSLETHTPVQHVEHEDHLSKAKDTYVVQTSRGNIIASNVIHCTNGFAGHLIPNLPGRLFPVRGTMSTQQPGSTFKNMGSSVSWSYFCKPSLDFDTGEICPGLYYAQQNAHTGTIFVGGEKQNLKGMLSSDDTIISDEARESLCKILPTIFNRAVEPVGAKKTWSGVLAFTSDGLPLVGKLTEDLTGRKGDGEWIAAGFNGHGMDKCWLTGQAIAEMVLGKITTNLPTAFLISEGRLARMGCNQALETFLGINDA